MFWLLCLFICKDHGRGGPTLKLILLTSWCLIQVERIYASDYTLFTESSKIVYIERVYMTRWTRLSRTHCIICFDGFPCTLLIYCLRHTMSHSFFSLIPPSSFPDLQVIVPHLVVTRTPPQLSRRQCHLQVAVSLISSHAGLAADYEHNLDNQNESVDEK